MQTGIRAIFQMLLTVNFYIVRRGKVLLELHFEHYFDSVVGSFHILSDSLGTLGAGDREAECSPLWQHVPSTAYTVLLRAPKADQGNLIKTRLFSS